MPITSSGITVVHQLAFQLGIAVLSAFCIWGKVGVLFFGQKDSGFKSIILDNVKGLAEKKKKKTNCLHDHKSLSKTLSDAPRYIRHTFQRNKDLGGPASSVSFSTESASNTHFTGSPSSILKAVVALALLVLSVGMAIRLNSLVENFYSLAALLTLSGSSNSCRHFPPAVFS